MYCLLEAPRSPPRGALGPRGAQSRKKTKTIMAFALHLNPPRPWCRESRRSGKPLPSRLPLRPPRRRRPPLGIQQSSSLIVSPVGRPWDPLAVRPISSIDLSNLSGIGGLPWKAWS